MWLVAVIGLADILGTAPCCVGVVVPLIATATSTQRAGPSARPHSHLGGFSWVIAAVATFSAMASDLAGQETFIDPALVSLRQTVVCYPPLSHFFNSVPASRPGESEEEHDPPGTPQAGQAARGMNKQCQEPGQIFNRRVAICAGQAFAGPDPDRTGCGYLQVVEADKYRLLAEEIRINLRPLPPRGLIPDRFGHAISQSFQTIGDASPNRPDLEQTLRFSPLVLTDQASAARS